MTTVLPFLLVAAVCGLVGWGLVRLRRRVQRRRAGSAGMSAAMGVFDEIWHPAAYDPQIEIQQSYERRAPSPADSDDENDDDESNADDAVAENDDDESNADDAVAENDDDENNAAADERRDG